jgi:hypothetical protein
MRNLSQDSWSLYQDLNPELPNIKQECHPLDNNVQYTVTENHIQIPFTHIVFFPQVLLPAKTIWKENNVSSYQSSQRVKRTRGDGTKIT